MLFVIEMNCVDFKVKGEDRSETTFGQISTFGGIFSPVSRMPLRILMELITVTSYHVHFRGHWFRVQGHGQHFTKMHFLTEAHQLINKPVFMQRMKNTVTRR